VWSVECKICWTCILHNHHQMLVDSTLLTADVMYVLRTGGITLTYVAGGVVNEKAGVHVQSGHVVLAKQSNFSRSFFT